jgi:phage shock protein PspC (stress-responsive transcriptional regulator)
VPLPGVPRAGDAREEVKAMRLFVSARHRRNFWALCAAVAGCALWLAAALWWPVLGWVLLGLFGLALLAVFAFVTWLVAMPSEELYRWQVGRREPGVRWPWR